MRPIISVIAFVVIQQTIIAQYDFSKTPIVQKDLKPADYTGSVIADFPDGGPKLRRQEKNGKADGQWLEWYPNGQLRYRAQWKNGMGNGLWEYFWPNGQLRSQSFYIDDMAQGLYLSYHENGQLAERSIYLNGQLDGISLTFDADGTPVSRRRYENDQRVLDEPVLFQPGIIATIHANEWGITFTPDGNTAYFTRRASTSEQQKIHKSERKENGEWSKPVIAEFSIDRDESPFITPDGKYFLFASCRPLPGQAPVHSLDMNLWCMTKTEIGWSKPKPLPEQVNGLRSTDDPWPKNYETGATMDLKGNLFYWTKSSANEVSNLFQTTMGPSGSINAPKELLPPSHEDGFDSGPFISPDGTLLIFTSENRSESFGGEDLYYSRLVNGQWSEPKNLGATINSTGNEGAPRFSPDGRYFYFTSDRGKNYDSEGEPFWSIYYMETRFLILE